MIKSIQMMLHTPAGLKASKKEAHVRCEYGDRARRVHPYVCRWHIEQKDKECARVKCVRYAEAIKCCK